MATLSHQDLYTKFISFGNKFRSGQTVGSC